MVAAVIEAYGYNYSFAAYRGGFHWQLLGISFACYSIGIFIDYLALSILSKSPVFIPELVALIFMVSTIIGIAVLSGKFFTWNRLDQVVALLVVAGIAWLTYRVEY